MIAIFLLLITSGAYGEVGNLLKAQTAQQVLEAHRHDEDVSILKQRCEAEMRGSYFPAHCFQWQEKAKLAPAQKRFYSQWFNSACIKSLKERGEIARFHLSLLRRLNGECRTQLKEAAQAWLYRVQREGDATVLNRPKIGNEIELVLRNETVAPPKPNRHPTLRALR